MMILPLCELVEIAPGLYALQQTRSLTEYVRDIASEFGDPDTLSIDEIEAEGDVISVRATLRGLVAPSVVNIAINPVPLQP